MKFHHTLEIAMNVYTHKYYHGEDATIGNMTKAWNRCHPSAKVKATYYKVGKVMNELVEAGLLKITVGEWRTNAKVKYYSVTDLGENVLAAYGYEIHARLPF